MPKYFERKLFLPSMSVFFYICEYLNITPKDFFDDGNKYPERLNELVEDLKKLDDDVLSYIAGLVKVITEKS